MYKYGLELKTDLSLGDLLRLVRLSSFAETVSKDYYQENPGRIGRVLLYLRTIKKILWVKKEMIRILTNSRFPLLATHKLTRIQNELGLNKEPQKGSKDPEGAINNIAVHLGAELGQTPLDILGGTTIKQAEQIHFKLELAKMENAIQAALAYHASPKEYIKQLQQDIKRLNADQKKLTRKHVPNDKKVIDFQVEKDKKTDGVDIMKPSTVGNLFKY